MIEQRRQRFIRFVYQFSEIIRNFGMYINVLLQIHYMKYWLVLFGCLWILAVNAQEDEVLPPSPKFKKVQKSSDTPPNPTSNTQQNDVPGNTTPDKKDEEFKPFSQKKKVDLSKFIIEPNFILSLGSNQFNIGLSPYVGYRVWQPKKSKSGSSNGLYLGGGITYYYTRYSLQYSDGFTVVTGKPNFHTYGGGIFAQYNIWKGFFARAKFEVLQLEIDDMNNWRPVYSAPPNVVLKGVEYPRIKETVPALLIGVGYNLLQSKNFFFPIMISYNVLHKATNSTYSPYRSGWVAQLGFINLF